VSATAVARKDRELRDVLPFEHGAVAADYALVMVWAQRDTPTLPCGPREWEASC